MSTSTKNTSRDGTSSAPPKIIDRWVTIPSVGALVLFVVAALVFPTTVSAWVDAGFTWVADWFGLYWQALLLVTCLVALLLIFTPWARAHLGGYGVPEFGRFKWIAMIMCTLLAGGGVFWAAAEPMYHFMNTPPYFQDVAAGSQQAVHAALAQSFVH